MSIDLFYVHTVSVETYAGSGAMGAAYSTPATVACFADDGAHLVRNTVGAEVVSSTVLYADPADAAKFVVDSRVTVNGRKAQVLTVNTRSSGLLGLPDHVEVHLT